MILLRYIKFCFVGAIGMLVDMLVLAFLVSPFFLHWNLTLSKAIAAEVAVCNNFFWNDLWTFRRPDHGSSHFPPRIVRLLKFNLICLAGIGWSVLLLNLQVRCLHLNLYLANCAAIVMVSLWNFWLSWKLGWRKTI